MKKEIAQTGMWLWGIARNPDLVWVDQETGTEDHEHCSRRFRFNVLWCSQHAFEKADEKNGEA